MKLRFARRRNRRQEESLTWLARLRRGLRESEGPDLVEWLQQSRNRSYIARAAVDGYAPEVVAVLSEIFPMDRFLTKPAQRRSPAVGILAVLAAIGVIAGAAVFVNHMMMSMSKIYTTGPNAGQRLELEDGTPVMLKAATRIAAGFTDHSRFVNVLYGEAALAVRPDPRGPFRVRAGGRELVTNSAVFDVRILAAKSAALTVLTGTAVVPRADLNAQDPATVVGPLETLQFGPDAQSGEKISDREVQGRLAWQRTLPQATIRHRWWQWGP
jgi:ferric-dicitrate binding protein FerR (iron transport regulator)